MGKELCVSMLVYCASLNNDILQIAELTYMWELYSMYTHSFELEVLKDFVFQILYLLTILNISIQVLVQTWLDYLTIFNFQQGKLLFSNQKLMRFFCEMSTIHNPFASALSILGHKFRKKCLFNGAKAV